MRPYGSDRIRVLDDGTVVLSCRLPKEGWIARTERTAIRNEHPGAAVLCEEGCFEVVAAETTATGVKYRLAPWPEQAAIRLPQPYDAASENARDIDNTTTIRQNKNRTLANILGVLTGHLPGPVQQHLAHELGVDAPHLTMISAGGSYVFFSVVIWKWIEARIAQTAPPPGWLVDVAGFLAIDAAIRFVVAWVQRRPIGSLPGLLLYAIFYVLHPRRHELVPPQGVESPLDAEQELSVNAEASDRILIWEPLLTLLSRRDQRRLAKYGFEYQRMGWKTALTILIFSLLGAISAVQTLSATPRFSAVLSLVTAGALSVEQIVRLMALLTGPSPSILRFVVRPLVRNLL